MERLRPFRELVFQVGVLTVAGTVGFFIVREAGWRLGDPGLLGLFLLIAAILYGMLAAVAAYVAWVQFSMIEVTASQEANVLDEIYALSSSLSDREEAQKLAVGIRRYIEMLLADEWRHLAGGRADPATHELFLDVAGRLRGLRARDPRDAQVVEDVRERIGPWIHFRQKRVTWGLTRMPRPLWALLCLLSWTVVLALLFYPGPDFGTQLACVVFGSAIVGWAQMAIRDLDNPFEGYCMVSSAAFEELGGRLNVRHQPRREEAAPAA